MMETKNGVPFRQKMLPTSKYSLKAPYAMTPRKITIHNTDNQMPAQNEISYMIGNSSAIGFHMGIDELEAIQGIPFNRNAFHAGDGKNGYGNRNTIGIEMCRNYDRSRSTTNLNDPLRSQFEKTFQNTIKVVAQLCVELDIAPSFDTIKQHKDWSGKHCPSKILNDKRWNELVNGIVAEYGRLKVQPIPATKPSTGDAWDARYGEAGPRVTQLQKDLVALGYKLSVDGSYGSATRDAVTKFQKDQKLVADGIYGPSSQAAMRQALAAKQTQASKAWDVRYGETGKQVGEVQQILKDLGYYKGAIDNSYGPAMLSAVKAFQRDHKLTQDGIFGPSSQAAAKKAQADKQATAKPPLYRVIRDGKQVGAFREGDNVLAEAQKAIASGAKNITIQKV